MNFSPIFALTKSIIIMNENKLTLRFGLIVGMILFAAISRLLPHPPNFTPVGAMTLFGAAYFGKKYWAIIVPLAAMWLTDVFLYNFIYGTGTEGFQLFNSYSLWVYAAIILIALAGTQILKKVNLQTVLPALVVGSLIFFLITNLSSFFHLPMYTKDLTGLIAAYAAGLPFYLNTLAGDLFYGLVLFGSFELMSRNLPIFQRATE